MTFCRPPTRPLAGRYVSAAYGRERGSAHPGWNILKCRDNIRLVREDVVVDEIEAYARELSWILHQICVSLDGLTAAQLNWRPSAAANSAYAIASHVVGSTNVYALGFGCGQDVTRDRTAEFAASGTDASGLIGAIRQLQMKIGDALGSLTVPALDERILPPPDLWGSGEPREISRREALVESVRHGALHLGELRLTRDLAAKAV